MGQGGGVREWIVSASGRFEQRSTVRRWVFVCACGSVLLLALAGIGGCSTLGFYQQAVSGQIGVLSGRRSVRRLLANPDTDPKLAEQLQLAQAALTYANETLLLDVGKRYASYTELKGDYVVWNLVVAQPDSVLPRQWCFPVAGCVVYRGYFNEARAQRVAQKYRAQGYDVYVGGVAAYSTLGWFNDPLLSSFIHWSRPALVQLLFHELAHGELYVAGDTAFNESFASFVAQKGIEVWLAGDAELVQQLTAEQRRRQEASRFNELLVRLRNTLQQDFAEAPTRAAALEVRVARYAQARECVAQWAKRTAVENVAVNERERFKRYFATPPNMARLALASAYNRWLAAFGQLFIESQSDAVGLDWRAFYAAAKTLGERPVGERERELQRLSAAAAASQQQIQTESNDDDPGDIRCEALTNHFFDRDISG